MVPLYNTGESIGKLFDAFRDLPISGGYELILVNDGSRDDTLTRASALLSSMLIPVILVDLARNFGEHAAVLEGFRHARGKFVINLDDDLQNPVEEALRLLDHIRATKADVVYAYYEEKSITGFVISGADSQMPPPTSFLASQRIYTCAAFALIAVNSSIALFSIEDPIRI